LVPKGADETGFLRDGNKHIGRNEPQVSIFPTRQRFEADNAIAVERYQRLVMRDNAVGRYRVSEVSLDLDAPLDMRVHPRFEKIEWMSVQRPWRDKVRDLRA
jgi:hypothetical protein